MGPLGCPKTSVTSNLCSVTSQKSEDLRSFKNILHVCIDYVMDWLFQCSISGRGNSLTRGMNTCLCVMCCPLEGQTFRPRMYVIFRNAAIAGTWTNLSYCAVKVCNYRCSVARTLYDVSVRRVGPSK